MDIENLSAIIFIVILSITLCIKRKNLDIHKIFFPFLYVITLKTKLGITRLRGAWHKLKIAEELDEIDTVSIFHPAFLLRQPERKRETWSDLKSIKKKLNKRY